MRWAGAGLAYWAIVLALGFVLGTLRVLWLAPLIGPLAATALELPVMLGTSWLAAGWLMRRYGIVRHGEGLAMGLFAFVLLLGAEAMLARVLAGQTFGQWLDGFAEPHAALGLAGQALFALFPWLRLRGSV